MNATRPRGYLWREAVLVLLFAYLVLAGGTVNGLVRFRLHTVSHALIALALIAWLGVRLVRKERVAASVAYLLVLLVIAAQLATTALSHDPRRSAGAVGLTLLYGLWLALVVDLLSAGWPAGLFVKSLLVVASIPIVLSLLEICAWYAGWLRLSGGQLLPDNLLRVYSLLGDANMLSAFLNLVLPFGLLGLIGRRGWMERLAAGGWTAANLFVQFFTSSRGGWLGTAATLATLVVLIWLAGGLSGREIAVWTKFRGWMIPVLVVVGVVFLAAAGAIVWRQLAHPSHGPLLLSRSDFWRSALAAFYSSPWSGTGPSTFSTEFMKYTPVPWWRPYPHAHSVPLTVAAEGGLIGLGALVVWVVGLLLLVVRRWKWMDGTARLSLAAPLAALAGFSVHSLLDNHLGFPAVAMVAAVPLALILKEPRIEQRTSLHPLWLAVPAALLVLGGAWSGRANAAFTAGVGAANAGQWREAAVLFEEAAHRDPGFAFYPLQAGYAWGVPALLEGDSSALQRAIAWYQLGVRLEPSYSLNHANLSLLYRQAGELDRSADEMRQAASAAPTTALYALTLAEIREQQGRTEEALNGYRQVLAEQPSLAEMSYYWGASTVRRLALAKRPSDGSPASGDDATGQGWQAYRVKDFGRARSLFAAGLAGAGAAEAYRGLGAACMAEKDFEGAARFLRMGLDRFAADEGDKLLLLLDYGRLAYAVGDRPEAIRRVEGGLTMLENSTIYGVGTRGWSPYAWFVFQRESIAPDMLPGLHPLRLTDDLAERFGELARWYQESGDLAAAEAVIARVAAVAPGWQPPANAEIGAAQ